MRRFFFNNSQVLDHMFCAFIGALFTMAVAQTVVNMEFETISPDFAPFARLGILAMSSLMTFLLMYVLAKQSIRSGIGFSSAINQSLLKDGDTVYVKTQNPKKHFAGTINLEKSLTTKFCVRLFSGKEIVAPIHHIVKLFDEL